VTIYDLSLSARAWNCLFNAGIDLPKLLQMTPCELLRTKGCGPKVTREIQQVLARDHGLYLPHPPYGTRPELEPPDPWNWQWQRAHPIIIPPDESGIWAI